MRADSRDLPHVAAIVAHWAFECGGMLQCCSPLQSGGYQVQCTVDCLVKYILLYCGSKRSMSLCVSEAKASRKCVSVYSINLLFMNIIFTPGLSSKNLLSCTLVIA